MIRTTVGQHVPKREKYGNREVRKGWKRAQDPFMQRVMTGYWQGSQGIYPPPPDHQGIAPSTCSLPLTWQRTGSLPCTGSQAECDRCTRKSHGCWSNQPILQRGYRKLLSVSGSTTANSSQVPLSILLSYNTLSILQEHWQRLPSLTAAMSELTSPLGINVDVVQQSGVRLLFSLSFHSQQFSSSNFLIIVFFPP